MKRTLFLRYALGASGTSGARCAASSARRNNKSDFSGETGTPLSSSACFCHRETRGDQTSPFIRRST